MEACTETNLRASVTAPSAARRIVADQAGLERFPDLRFAAQLLTSEIVANAVRHAGLAADDSLALVVERTDATLHVEVRDNGPGFDLLMQLAAHEQRSERHRGLVIVNALADRWGFRRGTDECCVWFELDLMPGRRPWRGREAAR